MSCFSTINVCNNYYFCLGFYLIEREGRCDVSAASMATGLAPQLPEPGCAHSEGLPATQPANCSEIENIKHIFFCWNGFTKHHFPFQTWGGHEILADLQFCKAVGTQVPAGKAPLIRSCAAQQELRCSGVIKLEQSA